MGRPSGAAQQATDWLVARAAGYTSDEIAAIVARYVEIGGAAGVDWFLALAQLAHETASLASWWSQPPRRNPAGIGVTGQTRPEKPATGAWQLDETSGIWREGVAFPSWKDDSIPAHVGRMLAYALKDGQASDAQRALITRAMSYRPLPASFRGAAPTLRGLAGRWAVPGTEYPNKLAQIASAIQAS